MTLSLKSSSTYNIQHCHWKVNYHTAPTNSLIIQLCHWNINITQQWIHSSYNLITEMLIITQQWIHSPDNNVTEKLTTCITHQCIHSSVTTLSMKTSPCTAAVISSYNPITEDSINIQQWNNGSIQTVTEQLANNNNGITAHNPHSICAKSAN